MWLERLGQAWWAVLHLSLTMAPSSRPAAVLELSRVAPWCGRRRLPNHTSRAPPCTHGPSVPPTTTLQGSPDGAGREGTARAVPPTTEVPPTTGLSTARQGPSAGDLMTPL